MNSSAQRSSTVTGRISDQNIQDRRDENNDYNNIITIRMLGPLVPSLEICRAERVGK